MKNILITGAAGFLGAHLSDVLLKNPENNIIAVDNFITSDFYNIEEFVRNPHFEFIKHDLIEPISIASYAELNKFKIKVYGIEEIYHLACPTSPKDYDRFPLETCLANSHATKTVLEIASQFKAKFLFISSSAVYGKVQGQDQPVKETHWGTVETLGPRACYIDGKRFAENLIVYYAAEHNFHAKILRVFNTYGPKMRLADGRIIPDLVSQALNNEPLVIYGNETTASTFCYVSDTIDAFTKMMDSDETGPFNIGGEYLYTVKDIAHAIIAIVESSSQIAYEEPLPYRDPEPLPDIALAKDRLGWIPITPIENGLITTIKAMRASRIHKFKPTE